MKINDIIMKLKMSVKDLKCSIGKKLLHNVVLIDGILDITNGETVFHGKNSIVDQGLISILNLISAQEVTGTGQIPSNGWTGISNSFMVVGSDTSTATTHTTTALAASIGISPGTKANIQSGINSAPTTGQFQTQWTSTWNPNTVSGTLGEIGLYLFIMNSATLSTFASDQGQSGAVSRLFSRMASADGKFTPFTINTTVPLSISWILKLTYTT